jgi:EAL domain-containing protein (putative c-di-GMP-specific phosphodiesterase class I)
VAKKIVACVARPYRMERHTLYTSCSVGVCIYPDDEADAQALMKGADTVMYHAKEKGRNQYQFFSREIGARAIDRLELENALWRAIKRKEFELHYQPCIDLDTGVITGVEALLRWRHPKLGLLPPAHFIPLAEETGLIVPIGQWVLRAACEQLKAWQALGIEDLRVAVNLSARQFWQLDLARQILATLSSCELQAHLLELEITESMAMQDPEGAKEILLQLERMGLSLTIDDFGTGYSSLTCLNRFPIHCLKIDRSFINGILKDGSDAAITKATIALAKSLNLRVIAEGVETKAQQLFLRQAGCDSAQGFLFGSPVLAAELTPQLRRA